jgi:hypothetical protein
MTSRSENPVLLPLTNALVHVRRAARRLRETEAHTTNYRQLRGTLDQIEAELEHEIEMIQTGKDPRVRL